MARRSILFNRGISPDTLPGGPVDLVWLDGADTATQTLDGSNNVSAMQDKSTAKVNFAQGTTAQRPGTANTQNGLRVLSFAEDGLDRDSNLLGVGPMTWIILANKTAAGAADDVMFESEKFRLKSRHGSVNAIELQTGADLANRLNGGTNRITLDTAYKVIICQFENDIMRMEIDGVALIPARGPALGLDPQGDANDRFVASGSETNWPNLGLGVVGMKIDVSDLNEGDTGTIDITAHEGGGVGGRDRYTRSDGGSFIDDGFEVGMGIEATGFSTGQNNHARGDAAQDRTLFAVAADTLTMDTGTEDDLADETSTDNRITSSNNITFEIAAASTTVLTVLSSEDVLNGPNSVGTGTVIGREDVPQGTDVDSAVTNLGQDAVSGGLGHIGNIGEFMAYARILSAQEKSDIRQYLINKWAI